VRVRLYAAAAEAVGQAQVEIDVAQMTAADLLDRLAGSDEQAQLVLGCCRVFADGKSVRAGEQVCGEEVEILPPFAGG
jgi:molybdopterin converting factor small subunit